MIINKLFCHIAYSLRAENAGWSLSPPALIEETRRKSTYPRLTSTRASCIPKWLSWYRCICENVGYGKGSSTCHGSLTPRSSVVSTFWDRPDPEFQIGKTHQVRRPRVRGRPPQRQKYPTDPCQQQAIAIADEDKRRNTELSSPKISHFLGKSDQILVETQHWRIVISLLPCQKANVSHPLRQSLAVLCKMEN